MSRPHDLKVLTQEFLELWCNEKNLTNGITYIDANVVQYHDNSPPTKGVDNILAARTKFVGYVPDFNFEVINMVCKDNKGWVFSRISGLSGGLFKESVDMTVWNEEGKLLFTRMCRELWRVLDSVVEDRCEDRDTISIRAWEDGSGAAFESLVEAQFNYCNHSYLVTVIWKKGSKKKEPARYAKEIHEAKKHMKK